MSSDDETDDPRSIRTGKPGDRVLRVRTRRPRLPLIERRLGGRMTDVARFLTDLATETPVVWMIALLAALVFLVPVPVWLFESSAREPTIDSYWIALWWAVSAFTTVGHSAVDLQTAGGRVIGSIYTVVSVMLFFGSVIAAFSSYFLLTWRRPKRQVIDTVNYYFQRIDQLSEGELDDLEDMARGLVRIAKEQAQAEGRLGRQADTPQKEL